MLASSRFRRPTVFPYRTWFTHPCTLAFTRMKGSAPARSSPRRRRSRRWKWTALRRFSRRRSGKTTKPCPRLPLLAFRNVRSRFSQEQTCSYTVAGPEKWPRARVVSPGRGAVAIRPARIAPGAARNRLRHSSPRPGSARAPPGNSGVCEERGQRHPETDVDVAVVRMPVVANRAADVPRFIEESATAHHALRVSLPPPGSPTAGCLRSHADVTLLHPPSRRPTSATMLETCWYWPPVNQPQRTASRM